MLFEYQLKMYSMIFTLVIIRDEKYSPLQSNTDSMLYLQFIWAIYSRIVIADSNTAKPVYKVHILKEGGVREIEL